MISCPCKSWGVYSTDIIGPPPVGAICIHNCEQLEVWERGRSRFFQGIATLKIAPSSQEKPPKVESPIEHQIVRPTRTSREKAGKKLSREVFTGELVDGVLKIDRLAVAKRLSRCDNCSVRVIIERMQNLKTQGELRYIFGCILPIISDFTGDSVDYLYEKVFKPMYCPKDIVIWKGKETVSVRGLSKMTSAEAITFIDRLLVEAADLGLIIPVADKNWPFKEMPELIEQN